MHLFIREPWQQSVANNIQKFNILDVVSLLQTKQTEHLVHIKIPQSLKKSITTVVNINFDRLGHLQ